MSFASRSGSISRGGCSPFAMILVERFEAGSDFCATAAIDLKRKRKAKPHVSLDDQAETFRYVVDDEDDEVAEFAAPLFSFNSLSMCKTPCGDGLVIGRGRSSGASQWKENLSARRQTSRV